MVRLATTTQPTFNFYQNEDGNFCLRCCCRSLLLFCCWSGQCQLIVLLLIQQVSCAWRVAQVSCGCVFFVFASSLLLVFLLFLTFLLWEIWGMNMPNLPEVYRLEDLLVHGCFCCAYVAAIDTPLTMIVAMGWALLWYSQCPDVLMTPLLHLLARPPCSSEADHHGSPCCIRGTSSRECYGASQWWCWSHPSQSVMALIFDCTHDCHWQCRRCLLMLVATVPSSNACVVFTARIINSVITNQKELSLY